MPAPDDAAAALVAPLPMGEQAHTIVPIWTFALFLLAYLTVSITIRARYRARRRLIEQVMVEVERKRDIGEELHWPQPRPSKKRTDESLDEEGNPVTPPKDPGDGTDGDSPSREKSPSKKGGKGKGKKKRGRGSSPLERSLSDPDMSPDPTERGADEGGSGSSGVTFETEESLRGPDSLDDEERAVAEAGATFDVEDVPERGKKKGGVGKGDKLKGVGKGVGKSAKGVGKSAQKKKESLKAKVSEASEKRGSGGNELRASSYVRSPAICGAHIPALD